MRHKPYGPYRRFVKRALDFILSGLAIIVLSPVLLITAFLVRVKLGSPVFFSQERPGRGERIFKLHKFRSMTDAKDKDGNLLPDDERLPKFGSILRSTSLDELPELFNIIKGEMSIIGPRPLMPSYLPYYTEDERRRHSVRPGLTGLAQVNGRSFITWEEIFAYDLEYVDHISFKNDLSILLKTVKKVVHRSDIADVTESFVGEDGKKHLMVNGKELSLHQPLDVERKNAARNRK